MQADVSCTDERRLDDKQGQPGGKRGSVDPKKERTRYRGMD
jgi:hypothetical protein